MRNRNKLRDAMRASRNTKPYESRASIRRKNAVNKRVDQFISGLGQLDLEQDSDATQKIIDEYYQPDEIPSSDTVTEMMGWDRSKTIYIYGGLAVIATALLLVCR